MEGAVEEVAAVDEVLGVGWVACYLSPGARD